MKYADFHIHTKFSDGEASAVQVLKRAKELGIECLAITDHYDPYDRQLEKLHITEEKLEDHFMAIRTWAQKLGLKVLCGVETCTDFKGNLRLGDRIAGLCDIIITSPHYVEYDRNLKPGCFFDEAYWDAYKEKVLNMAEGEGTVLGHCEGYLPIGAMLEGISTTFEERIALCQEIAERFFDDTYLKRLEAALKKSGKALELHCPTKTPREKVIKRMADAGVRFSVGSDAHLLDWVGKTGWGAEMLEKVGGALFYEV